MANDCTHRRDVRKVVPSARLRGVPGGRERVGAPAAVSHLRPRRCCDDSPHRHATAHFHATAHPVIEGYDPPDEWGRCFVDRVMLDLGDDTTPQDGPIPRFV